ncbi:DoxX family protein [Gracilibacillus kekensis]|uniref:DoxX-like family protein n=1 Tax=Gracilibacillus kekensis TaxID=1027249 RepID=A0A1M7QGE4_9BACI|nr:DoxX family protein [Gracilibacillus kekensis]SHN30019.1 DoxX-like family protein [Gracilibacillus kekensis]
MVISYVLQGILGVVFLSIGIQKIMGDQLQMDIFKNLKLPQWFRVVTGWVELVGVVGLVIGFWLPWFLVIAGLWFGVTMMVGMITHIRVKDPLSKIIPASVFLAVSVMLIIINW